MPTLMHTLIQSCTFQDKRIVSLAKTNRRVHLDRTHLGCLSVEKLLWKAHSVLNIPECRDILATIHPGSTCSFIKEDTLSQPECGKTINGSTRHQHTWVWRSPSNNSLSLTHKPDCECNPKQRLTQGLHIHKHTTQDTGTLYHCCHGHTSI